MTNAEFKIQLEKRTVAFSVAVLKMLRALPIGFDTRNIRDQVTRSATAVGANYREANRAESKMISCIRFPSSPRKRPKANTGSSF